MAAQTSYSFVQPRAVPGGAVDVSPHSIVARSNGETVKGAVKFGMGVVQGDEPGKDALLPTAASTSAQFEGVVCTGVAEMDMEGRTALGKTETLGVMVWGKRWVRVPDGLSVAYGDTLYLITNGADAGKFSNDSTDAIAVGGRFIGASGSDGIAPAELYNAASA